MCVLIVYLPYDFDLFSCHTVQISQLSMDSGGHGDNELAVVLPEQESQVE